MSSLPTPFLPPSLSGLKSTPKLHLYTAGTPNGFKVSTLLEELILAYPKLAEEGGPLTYDITSIKFSENQQKSAEFLKVNPNGRIPALVDDNQKSLFDGETQGFRVFETASILIWLVENYDKENKFWFADPRERSEATSWIFFGHGGVGPMQGQANHFFRYAPEKIPYGIKRYQDETNRLYSVLEDGLKATKKQEYLVGDKLSIADLSIFGWVRSHSWAGIDITPYPLLSAWLDRIASRPGIKAGLDIPEKQKPKKLTPEEEEAQAKENSKWIMGGQK